MPKYKMNTKQFVISVATTGGGQYKATIPKQLVDSLAEDGVTEIDGRFSLDKNELVLTEESRVITIGALLAKWWNTNIPVPNPADPNSDGRNTADILRELDMDEILTAIGVQVDWQGRNVQVGDWDDKTYSTDTIWVHFVEE